MAYPLYDVEALMNDIKAFLQSKLNAQLLIIDAEKADGLTLAPVDNAAYFWNWMGDEVANYNPFVFYGIDSEQPASVGAGTVRNFTIQVFVVLTDSQNDPEIMRRMYRYQRALFQIFEKNWSTIGRGVNFEITGLLPFVFSLFQAQNAHRGIGIQLTASLG